jgi:hypothetical protein
MKRFHSIARCGFVLALLVAASLVQVQSQAQGSRPHRIAVFGSSVANGTGDEFGKEGYTGMLREMFAPRGWEVVNQSRGGDNDHWRPVSRRRERRPKVRYLLPQSGRRDWIVARNEESSKPKKREGRRVRCADGTRFVDRSREHNIVPVVALVYPHGPRRSV